MWYKESKTFRVKKKDANSENDSQDIGMMQARCTVGILDAYKLIAQLYLVGFNSSTQPVGLYHVLQSLFSSERDNLLIHSKTKRVTKMLTHYFVDSQKL